MMASPDTKSHYGCIIIGSGISGLAMNIQLKRKLGFTDTMVYEEDSDIGGTWQANTYPGAGCDIPIGLYHFSFAPSAEFGSQWASQAQIKNYLDGVVKKFDIQNIAFNTHVEVCQWDADTGLWTVEITNKHTKEKTHKTCNVLISAVGGLREPNIPGFAKNSEFNGDVFHSARWNHKVDITNKDVVLVGNGCSAAQIVPEIIDQVKSLTQVARSRQTVLPRPAVPDGKFWWLLLRLIPGLLYLQRFFIFMGAERFFVQTDLTKGEKIRQWQLKKLTATMKEKAPEKYWKLLEPDFDVAAKRRIFDSGYLEALHNDKFRLVQDDAVTKMDKDVVITEKGVTVKADVVVLSTGFRVQEFFYPLKVYNEKKEALQDRIQKDKKQYRGTFCHGFPNFATIMGLNTATGHSSVIFTSECQVNLILKIYGPVFKKIQHLAPSPSAGPSAVVTREAEDEYYAKMRKQMETRVWEKNGGVSWYVDSETKKCTTLYPWSQVNFWWHTAFPNKSHFAYSGL